MRGALAVSILRARPAREPTGRGGSSTDSALDCDGEALGERGARRLSADGAAVARMSL